MLFARKDVTTNPWVVGANIKYNIHIMTCSGYLEVNGRCGCLSFTEGHENYVIQAEGHKKVKALKISVNLVRI